MQTSMLQSLDRRSVEQSKQTRLHYTYDYGGLTLLVTIYQVFANDYLRTLLFMYHYKVLGFSVLGLETLFKWKTMGVKLASTVFGLQSISFVSMVLRVGV